MIAQCLYKWAMQYPTANGTIFALTAATLATFMLVATPSVYARSGLTDDQARDQMIQESIRGYRGNCPCPYNSASNGSRCGKRSAYSRAGGAQLFCYREDISNQALTNWRKQTGR